MTTHEQIIVIVFGLVLVLHHDEPHVEVEPDVAVVQVDENASSGGPSSTRRNNGALAASIVNRRKLHAAMLNHQHHRTATRIHYYRGGALTRGC